MRQSAAGWRTTGRAAPRRGRPAGPTSPCARSARPGRSQPHGPQPNHPMGSTSMTDHRSSAGRVIPRRILLSGVWLGTVAVLSGILSYLVTTQGNPEAGPGAQDTPFAQLAREDLHAPVWSLAFASDGAYLA